MEAQQESNFIHEHSTEILEVLDRRESIEARQSTIMGSGLRAALKGKWLGLCVGMWLQACGGISYVFPLYSADLKAVLGYNQEMIDGIGTFKDIGGNVGIISGLLIDATAAWFVLLIGGLLHLSFFTMVRHFHFIVLKTVES